MGQALEYIPVVMTRPHLRDIPQFVLPEGYRMRAYRPGDRETWLAIWSFETWRKVTGEAFDSNFGADLPAMERRCMFLVAPDGSDVGTVTAWYDKSYRHLPWGRIHWVSIVPDHRGMGLSRCIMTAGMNRLAALGHRRAVLTTQAPRLAAIRTYLKFGFVPDMSAKDARRAWASIRRHIR